MKSVKLLGIGLFGLANILFVAPKAFASSSSCTVRWSGSCSTPAAVQAGSSHSIGVNISWSNGSCGQWQLRDINNGVIVKTGGWSGWSGNTTVTVKGLYSRYILRVDPGAGITCVPPAISSVTGTIYN
jgi:hypothetical protein